MYAYLTCFYFLKKIAEEFSKFAFPASEVVFRGLLPAREKEEWSWLARLVEFVQNHARNGWREEDAQTFMKWPCDMLFCWKKGGVPLHVSFCA